MKNHWTNYLSTILGGIVAIAVALQGMIKEDFEFNTNSVTQLVLASLVALGGYMTSINTKSLNQKAKND